MVGCEKACADDVFINKKSATVFSCLRVSGIVEMTFVMFLSFDSTEADAVARATGPRPLTVLLTDSL